MANENYLHINLDTVLETLRRGVRRSDVFMGIGINAAEQNPAVSHLLAPDNVHQIHLVKEELTDSEKAHVAIEFGKWVRANGLRELLETFSIFLHELYSATFVVSRQAGKLRNLARYPPPRFERMGIGDQIETIARAISVSADDIRIIRSLNQARNCYAHRRGLVGDPDITDAQGTFTVHWTAFQMEVQEPDGTIVPESEMFGARFQGRRDNSAACNRQRAGLQARRGACDRKAGAEGDLPLRLVHRSAPFPRNSRAGPRLRLAVRAREREP